MSDNEDIIYDKIVEGINYLSLEKYEDAISSFDEVLSIDNSHLAALNNKAFALNGLKKFDDAIILFDKILNIDSDFIFSLIGKGESLFNLKYYDYSILYFDRAIKLDGRCDVALLNKSIVYEKCNQFEEALKCLNRVKNISGYNFIDKNRYNKLSNKSQHELFDMRIAFTNKINRYISLNKFDEVYSISNDALNHDKNSLYFLFNKAYSLYMLGNFDESLSLIDEILKIDFMNINALDIKSRIFIKTNDYVGALNCLNKIKQFGGSFDSSLYKDISAKVNSTKIIPDGAEKYIFEGNELSLQGDLEGALHCYDLALDCNSNSIIALNNKGYVQYLLNDYFNAVNTFNLALRIDDEYVYSLIGKSYSLYYLNYFVDSLNCFNKAIENDKSVYNQNFIDLLNNRINNL